MTSLLGLPREVRDMIIAFVIQSPLPAPETWTDSDRLQKDCRDICIMWSRQKEWPTCKFITDEKAYESNMDGLLLTNRQLRAESLDRLRAQQQPYTVDIKIDSAKTILPTWTCIPLGTTAQIPTLIATVKGIGDCPTPQLRTGYVHFGSGFGSLYCAFEYFLMRLLVHGPVPPTDEATWDTVRYRDRYLTIKTLIIDVVDPTEEDLEPFNDAKFIAQFLKNKVESVMGHWPVKYGDLGYRRVGEIKITMNGERYADFDLSRWLRFVPRLEIGERGPGYTTREELRNWFLEVCGERRDAGIAAPEDDAWLHCDEVEYREHCVAERLWRNTGATDFSSL